MGVIEQGDRQSRPRRSRWPRIVPGPVGAVHSLVWLTALRNWFSLVRLGLLTAGLAAPMLFPALLQNLAEPKATFLFLGAGLTMGLFNYGEQAAALFAADGERVALLLLAGVRPLHLLAGKWLAALPLPVVAALTTLVWALAGGTPPAQALALSATSLAIALGSLTWLIGLAAFDAAPRESSFHLESEQLAAAFEQVPTRPGGIVGLVGAALLTGVAVWLCTSAPAGLVALVVLPVSAVGAGYWWLNRLMRLGMAEGMPG